MRLIPSFLILTFSLLSCDDQATGINAAKNGDEVLIQVLQRRLDAYPDTPPGRYSREATTKLREELERDAPATLERIRQTGAIYEAARVPDRDAPPLERVHASLLARRGEIKTIRISFDGSDELLLPARNVPLRGKEVWQDVCTLSLAFYLGPKGENLAEVDEELGSLPVFRVPNGLFGKDFRLSIEWNNGSRTNAIEVGKGT